MEWKTFYRVLNRVGPELLQNIDPALKEYVDIHAEDPGFLCDSAESGFDLWHKGEFKEAAESALTMWLWQVQRDLRGILDPYDSLIWHLFGDRRKVARLERSIDKIEIAIDDEHLDLLIDSILLDEFKSPEAPSLALPAILNPVERTNEGQLIRSLAEPWRALVRLAVKDWTIASHIPPTRWEEIIAAAFDGAGYDEVILTPRSGDFGRDVIAVKKGVGSIRILASVKAFAANRLVRHDDVRALAGVLLGDPSASKGIIATTSGFAPGIPSDPFLKPLMPYRLELMDGVALQKWLRDLALRKT